ncbi:PAS domain-containing sensor histidine kinase [Leptospira jelokensis]|uniref:PAS domain-containing sensor histidine kinase n=1 Tax=Leptospira jelokensis TaxID=2484931 RepID=UPI001090B095|nr:PAS domain-containing sensor histidine kinase [Leptospira jelokensis]TGL99175.1 PAS domain-containing sensor histidine kinase [Leptospira jelokensis]
MSGTNNSERNLFFGFANQLNHSVFLFETKEGSFDVSAKLVFANEKAKETHPNLKTVNDPMTIGSLFPFIMEIGNQNQVHSCFQNNTNFEEVITISGLHSEKTNHQNFLFTLSRISCTHCTVLIERLSDVLLAEKALKQKETKLNRFLKTMINGVVVVNTEGQILYANDSAANILELELETIENRYFSSREWKQIDANGDPYPIEKLPLAIALGKGETVYNCEHGIVSEGGKPKWLNVNATPIYDEEGNLEGATASFLDVTELKNTQNTIQLQNKKLTSILDAIERSAIVSVTDANGNITRVNSKFLNLCGYSESEIIGKNHRILNAAYHPKEFWSALWKEIKSGHTWEGIIKNKSKDGNYFWLQTFIHPLYDEKNQIESFLSIRFDITEEIEAPENTKRMLHFTGIQNNRLQNFAYIVSHNIRQHSSNFTSLVQLLEDSNPEEDKTKIIQMLHTSSVQLEETITHLNDIISINQMLNKPMEICSLRNEVDKTLTILKGSIESRNIQVEVRVPNEIECKTIPAYLESILLNLISNAVKYVRLKKGAFIRIEAAEKNEQIVFTVEDNGLGINLQKHGNKIFGMFKTFHRNEDARGIGLFITKSQVEVLGGSIALTSEEGKGSVFRVTLPKHPERSLRA